MSTVNQERITTWKEVAVLLKRVVASGTRTVDFNAVKWRNLFNLEKSLDWKEKSYSNLCVNRRKKNRNAERKSVKRNAERKIKMRNVERKNERRNVGS